jgi:hypothetical protein
MYTASAVFHLRHGITPFQLALLGAIALFVAWMTVQEARRGIRSRTFGPWAWTGFGVDSIAVLLAIAGLSTRIAACAGAPAVLFAAVMLAADRHDPQRYTKRDAARNREYYQYLSRKGHS